MIIKKRIAPPASHEHSVPGVVLGIDASYSGLAIVQIDENEIASAVVGRFPGKKEWGAAQRLMRIYRIEDWLAGVLTAWANCRVDAVCMEGYARNAKQGREEAGELAVTVRRAVYQHLHLVPCMVAPLQLKKFVTGTTKAQKQEMLLAVYKRWGYETNDDNKADAYGLARIARALCQHDTNLIGAQEDVLRALESDKSWALSRAELAAMDTPA